MKKYYEEIELTIIYMTEEVVRTSLGSDPFDDGYQDPNISGFNNAS